MESDPKLPSVCSLVTGEPLRGSWWSHPLAQTIFQINEQLEDHEDVLITKLVSGKVTFVHRQIWSETIAIGRAHEVWQLKDLLQPVQALLSQIESRGSVTTAEVVWPRTAKMKLGDAAGELEKKLLIVGTQFHSESGAHQKQLETWEHWMKRRKFKAAKISAQAAKAELEMRLSVLNAQFDASAKLPWQREGS
ncbi:MAG TPA: hypothetical protein VJS64_11945 [Pyrinomonadaceae bacterium]|nr:hypothetical protein [Pyrinomonadaceae bacterium]